MFKTKISFVIFSFCLLFSINASGAEAKIKITAVNSVQRFVVLEAGKNSGLRVGDELALIKGGIKIARFKVVEVRENISAADITEEAQSGLIKVGDEVTPVEGTSTISYSESNNTSRRIDAVVLKTGKIIEGKVIEQNKEKGFVRIAAKDETLTYNNDQITGVYTDLNESNLLGDLAYAMHQKVEGIKEKNESRALELYEEMAKLTVESLAIEVEYYKKERGRYPLKESELVNNIFRELGRSYFDRYYDGQVIERFEYHVTLMPDGYKIVARPYSCGYQFHTSFIAENGKTYEMPCN